MSTQKLKTRMRMLLAMVRQGEAGERDNADRALSRLLKKHGYTISDIDSEEEDVFDFRVKSDEERVVLLSLISKVRGGFDVRISAGKRNFSVLLTQGEHATITAMWEIYRDEWKKEATRTLRAFVNQNELYPESCLADQDKEKKKLTREDVAELERIRNRMNLMDTIRPDRMLPGSES